jgi:hypothetical protein
LQRGDPLHGVRAADGLRGLRETSKRSNLMNRRDFPE